MCDHHWVSLMGQVRCSSCGTKYEPLYSDPLTGPAEDANRLRAVRDVASRRHLYTDLGHYADAVDQALDGPTTQGEDA